MPPEKGPVERPGLFLCQAIHGAVAKLKRAITTVVDKHEAHRHTRPGKGTEADEANDPLG